MVYGQKKSSPKIAQAEIQVMGKNPAPVGTYITLHGVFIHPGCRISEASACSPRNTRP